MRRVRITISSMNNRKPYIKYTIIILVLFLGVFLVTYYGKDNNSVPDESWTVMDDTTTGVTFHFPEDIKTTYIHTVDWPPKVNIYNEIFDCTEAGEETDRAGKTEKRTIGGTEYCVTVESEGAAGSVYSNYAYSFLRGQGTIILTFSLRAVQCANYPESQRIACEAEREDFEIDETIHKIAESLEIVSPGVR